VRGTANLALQCGCWTSKLNFIATKSQHTILIVEVGKCTQLLWW